MKLLFKQRFFSWLDSYDIYYEDGMKFVRRKAGEYDLIVTKSVSRFARNLVDCISLIRKLKISLLRWACFLRQII